MARRASAAEDDRPTLDSLGEARDAVDACRACPLWANATQGVPGEGPRRARLMLVGEQPGDREDLAGHPFVGPAGHLLDRALADAELDRRELYVTNAVKHFKHELRGKRRLHKKPTVGEVRACHWWLGEELRLVRPALVVALGATAILSLLGKSAGVQALRGTVQPLTERTSLWVTVHPSFLLRLPSAEAREREYRAFVADLAGARKWVDTHAAR
jgi:DNA polymerase